jgi:hypothetical protein
LNELKKAKKYNSNILSKFHYHGNVEIIDTDGKVIKTIEAEDLRYYKYDKKAQNKKTNNAGVVRAEYKGDISGKGTTETYIFDLNTEDNVYKIHGGNGEYSYKSKISEKEGSLKYSLKGNVIKETKRDDGSILYETININGKYKNIKIDDNGISFLEEGTGKRVYLSYEKIINGTKTEYTNIVQLRDFLNDMSKRKGRESKTFSTLSELFGIADKFFESKVSNDVETNLLKTYFSKFLISMLGPQKEDNSEMLSNKISDFAKSNIPDQEKFQNKFSDLRKELNDFILTKSGDIEDRNAALTILKEWSNQQEINEINQSLYSGIDNTKFKLSEALKKYFDPVLEKLNSFEGKISDEGTKEFLDNTIAMIKIMQKNNDISLIEKSLERYEILEKPSKDNNFKIPEDVLKEHLKENVAESTNKVSVDSKDLTTKEKITNKIKSLFQKASEEAGIGTTKEASSLIGKILNMNKGSLIAMVGISFAMSASMAAINNALMSKNEAQEQLKLSGVLADSEVHKQYFMMPEVSASVYANNAMDATYNGYVRRMNAGVW